MISPRGWKEVHPEEDVVPPRKPLSIKTICEMYVGRRALDLWAAEELKTIPPDDLLKFRKWVEGFMK